MAAAVSLAADHAQAAAPRTRLVYSRGADIECPAETALKKAVIARVGYDPFFAVADQTMIATISQNKSAELVGRVEIVNGDGVGQGAREITATGPDCSALFDTLALTIAIAIDPHALSRPPSEQPPEEPPPTPPAPPVPSLQPEQDRPPPAAPAPARPDSSWTIRLAAALRGDAGVQPSVAPGIAAAIGVEPTPRYRLGLEVSTLLPSSTAFANAEVTGWLLRGSFLPCMMLLGQRLHACGLASIGRFAGSAQNAANPTSGASVFVAAGGRIGVEVPVTARAALTLDTEVAANLYRTTLLIGAEQAWRASPVMAGLAAGVAVRF